MWECPNYLKIDGRQFLIICPQGMKTDGLDYADSDQCGYFPLKYDFAGRDYELGAFRQMDRGFDLFVNDGEEVFTTRIYDSMTDLHVKLEAGRLRGQAEYYQF